MDRNSTQGSETWDAMMVGGSGFALREFKPATCNEQSVLDDVKKEIGLKLGIDPEFVRFLDQYQLERAEKIGEGAYPLVREAIAIQIVNFLGLPDLMGKMQYLDLRDSTTSALLKTELRNSERNNNHAINLFKQRFERFFNHISMVLEVDQMQQFCDEIEVYFGDLSVRRDAIAHTLGNAGVSLAEIIRA